MWWYLIYRFIPARGSIFDSVDKIEKYGYSNESYQS